MATNKLKNLNLGELQEKRVKTKQLLGAGIGAWIAFALVLIVPYFLFRKLTGIFILQNFLAGSLMFGFAVWSAYSKLQNIDTELENRVKNKTTK